MRLARTLKLPALPSLRREMMTVTAVVVLVSAAVLALGLHYVKPAPPRRLVIVVSPEGGARHYARQYKEILARVGVELELRETTGAQQSVSLLETWENDVDAAIFPSGVKVTGAEKDIRSLGGLAYVPIWIFHRGAAPLDDVSQLAGKRLSAGPEGGAAQVYTRQLLEAVGLGEGAATLVAEDRETGTQALLAGRVDALVMIAPAESPSVQTLARAEGIRLLSMARAEAMTRRFPSLRRLVLPRGVLDLAKDVPSEDVVLLSPTATLAVHESVHPALVHLLLRAASEVHGGAGLLDKAGEFPAPYETGYPMSDAAKRYYQSGGSLLERYLPFWAGSLVDRLWVMLLPLFGVVLPLFRMLPPLYRWRVQSRIYRWYARLKELELEYESHPPADEGEALSAIQRINELEQAINQTPTPLSHSSSLYVLREHVDLLRRRFEAGRRPISTSQSAEG